jgi:hypothetical protein
MNGTAGEGLRGKAAGEFQAVDPGQQDVSHDQAELLTQHAGLVRSH